MDEAVDAPGAVVLEDFKDDTCGACGAAMTEVKSRKLKNDRVTVIVSDTVASSQTRSIG